MIAFGGAGGDDPVARVLDAAAEVPALQERLGGIAFPDAFAAELLAVASELGLDLDPAALARSGASRAVTSDEAVPPLGWLPARSVATGGAPAFDWLWFGSAPVSDPFYFDAVRRLGFRPFARATRVRTSLDTLVRGAAAHASLAPDGLIFHLSRCGSTLAAQMLAASSDHIVLSEPEPLDAVVRWAATSGAPLQDQVAALRAIVATLGRNRSGTARRFFLKLDAWHILSLPLFRAAFPKVPWIFVYREPEEVMVSHAREPGLHVVPGILPPAVTGIAGDGAPSLTDYAAQVLGRIMGAAVDGLSLGGGMLVHYGDIGAAMLDGVPEHFGFRPDPGERAAMRAAAGRDAKDPARSFTADTALKRAEVTVQIAAAVEAHAAAPYAELERLRADTSQACAVNRK
ncbi:hypothetical protein M9980_10020 [Sphingomonas donggukensis]|uniref:Aspartyl beta-hydroxylase n=1 Tax=Sphingomonas donggukensis TaxID=2949093 RepID=A0ABY4TR92_9SPHN|nr:hypothetical protein [Sphingomonas donggukensis]URW74900.1 hypothetical protein M9980_10020 [Sphingomonas donggukensis]